MTDARTRPRRSRSRRRSGAWTFALLPAFAAAILAARSVACPSTDAASSSDTTPTPRPGTFVIVSTEPLRAAADAWSAHRSADGWRVVRVELPPDTDDPARVRSLIRSALREAPPDRERAILLLGDAEDIPPFRFEQPDPRLRDRRDSGFVSDHPYRLLDDRDQVPDASLGRIPVDAVEPALGILRKIEGYERQAPGGAWRSRLAFVAGEGRFGAADTIIELLFRAMLDVLVPPAFDVSMTYASCTSVYCPPPSALESAVLARFSEGNVLLVYLGHGHMDGLDSLRWQRRRWPMLRQDALAQLDTPRADLPIAFLGCCSAGWFDRSDGDSLAESLLRAPGGPVALIAGSRPTHPYGTAVLQKDLTEALLVRRAPTVGLLDRAVDTSMLVRDAADLIVDGAALPIALSTRWTCTLDELRLMHVRLYNLLGDPATRIAHPRGHHVDLTLRAGVLEGAVPSIRRGSAAVILETAREHSAHEDELRRVTGADDPALESKAAFNYPRANRRRLLTLDGAVEDGRFAVRLPDALPDGAAVVRVEVAGVDADGAPIEAAGGLRLPAPAR